MMKRSTCCIMLTIVLSLAIAGCSPEKGGKEPESEVAAQSETVKLSRASIKEIGLETEIVSKKPFARYCTMPAKVLPNQDNEALVGSLVQGRVCKVFVKTGDYVKSGQVLMLVEGLEIGEIKAGFISARANLAYQKANYERQKKLLEENVGSQKNLLETQNEYEKAIADYAAQKNKISAIGLDPAAIADGKDGSGDHESGSLPVASPISGIVVERNVVTGQAIEATTTAFKIINLVSVWVDGQMNEKDVGRISGQKKAEFALSSYPAESFTGNITYIGQLIDETTRTLTVRAEFSNPKFLLKPQMFGELRVPGGNTASAVLVPAEAIVKIDGADCVFIQKTDSSFDKKAVTLGTSQSELVEIKGGLNEGEKVVVKGAFYLKSELLKSALGGE